MAFTAYPAAGDDLTAATLQSLISELRPIFVRKVSDETVNNSAVLQNDDELVAAVVANATYEVFLRLIVNSGTTPDFKYTFTAPSGATGSAQLYTGSNPDTAASSLQGPASITATGAASGVGADQVILVQGILIVSSTSGNLQFQWAQNTANASNSSVKANSYLLLRRVA
jgi:hypothetical protein